MLTRFASEEAINGGMSQSYRDLQSALVGSPNGAFMNGGTPGTSPTKPRGALGKALAKAEARSEVHASQRGENEIAELVIVCEPEGSALQMGGLHPRASLYERPVNMRLSKEQHANFRQVLRNNGLKVLTVREILAHGVDVHVGARLKLEKLAMKALTYSMAEGHTEDDLVPEDRKYLSDEYKSEVMQQMSVEHLIDTILTNPHVKLSPSGRDTGFTSTYTFKPLSNLIYTRDQQITTCNGIVMGRLRSQQRQQEVELMRFCFDKLGMPVIGEIEEGGFLEGGDFVPVSADLAMLGVGLRSNVAAAKQLMDQDLLGTRRFAVVRDDFECHQDRMHLDCVFAVLGPDTCLMLEEMMGQDSPTRRLVDEYVCRGPGKWELAREGVELVEFMEGEGFSIIPISGEHQLAYGCNVLNLGDSRIISVHGPSARQICEHPSFKGDIQVIDFSAITSMYGSVHCGSQVVRRRAGTGSVKAAWMAG